MGIPLTNTAPVAIRRHLGQHPVVAVLLIIIACATAATVIFPQSADLTGPLGYMVATTAAGIVSLSGARKLEGRERLAWSILGVALLTASVGLIAIGVVSSSGVELPAFGPIDGFFIVSYLLVCVSVVTLPHTDGRWSTQALGLVDGLVGAIAVGAVAWVWFLSGYFELLAAAPPLERVIAMAYPVLDVAILISLLMLSVRQSRYQFDPRLLMLSIGMAFQVAADLAYAATGVGELFADAKPVYPLNLAAGFFLLATASIVSERPAPREFADRPTRWVTLIAPYGAAAVMSVGLVWQAIQSDAGHLVVLAVGTLAVVALTITRQAVSIREYRYRVDEDRQSLVSSISHELRTPLTVMVGMLELMRLGDQRLSTEEHDEFLETVTAQASYMGRMVSDLMLVARDLDGLVEIAPAPLELDELIRTAVSHVEGSQAVEIRARAMTVVVDGGRLQQAIANLVSNAIKYGNGQVLVTAERGVNLVIEVHDDGPGVPTKYEWTIWNRFERGPRNLDSRIPGSGIGPAIVAKVARAHGGHAGYHRSEILGGACFFVSIPVRAIAHEVPRHGTLTADRIAV
ncbi:MAG: ATP-binding protein [Acidimicrobiia bacterium]